VPPAWVVEVIDVVGDRDGEFEVGPPLLAVEQLDLHVAQAGTHQELASAGGPYRELLDPHQTAHR